MDSKEAISKLKYNEARIVKVQKKIEDLTNTLKEKLDGDLTRKQKARLKKGYKDRIKLYKDSIREYKCSISKCKRALKPKKQVQLNTIVPVSMDVELPLIKENLLKTVKGLKATEKGTFVFNDIEYVIDNIENKNKRTGTEVIFKPVKLLDSSITLSNKDSIEDYANPVSCTLHKGYYVVKEDGFNHVKYEMSAEEEREKRKLYNRFYYRNRTIAKRREGKKQVKVCKHCGKEFITYNKKTIFCSKECAELHKIKPTLTKVCAVCGKEFTTTYSTQIVCSEKCRNKRRNMLYYPHTPKSYKVVCSICGKEFTSNSKINKYCSDKCRDEARQLSYKKYYKKKTLKSK